MMAVCSQDWAFVVVDIVGPLLEVLLVLELAAVLPPAETHQQTSLQVLQKADLK